MGGSKHDQDEWVGKLVGRPIARADAGAGGAGARGPASKPTAVPVRQVVSQAQQDYLADVSEEPPPPASPYAYAPAGTPHAAPPVNPPTGLPPDKTSTKSSSTDPSSGNTPPATDPEVIEKGLQFVDADRLRAMAEHLPKVLKAIDEARKASAAMRDFAKQQKIDLEKPDEVAAGLKGAVSAPDKKFLEDAQSEYQGRRNELEKFLTDVRAVAESLKDDLHLLREAKANKEGHDEEKKKIEEHEKGGDLEHAYDATVSVLKALSDIATAMSHGPLLVFDFVQGGMELPGVDLIKDWIKSDEATDKKIDLLFKTVEQVAKIQITDLKARALVSAKTLSDYKRLFGGFYDAYVTAAKTFGVRVNEILESAAKPKSGKSGSPAAHRLVQVRAAVEQNFKTYENVNVVKSMSPEFAHLPYWYKNLVPLGKLVHDLRDDRDPDPKRIMTIQDPMLVYEKGGHQTVFHLPPQGLGISLEELSKGLQALQKFSEADVAGAERLVTLWEHAIVNAL